MIFRRSNRLLADEFGFQSNAEKILMSQTFLTTDELAARIKYDARTIRQCLKDSVLLEGRHYVRAFGRRKILYLWENIEEDLVSGGVRAAPIPMAAGGTCNG